MPMENAKRAQQRLIDKGYAIVADGGFGAKSIAALMGYVANGAPVTPLRTSLGEAAAKYFAGADITTALRLAHALAQQSVETGGFARLVEGFNYSQDGLRGTFGVKRISDADCKRLGRKTGAPALSRAAQEEIANIVYGGEFGLKKLGNDKPGDGWKFRGRGAKQITGRFNYTEIGKKMALDLAATPELLENPDLGMRAACIFWKDKNCRQFADADDIDKLTLAINGGDNGIEDRRKALTRAKSILL